MPSSLLHHVTETDHQILKTTAVVSLLETDSSWLLFLVELRPISGRFARDNFSSEVRASVPSKRPLFQLRRLSTFLLHRNRLFSRSVGSRVSFDESIQEDAAQISGTTHVPISIRVMFLSQFAATVTTTGKFSPSQPSAVDSSLWIWHHGSMLQQLVPASSKPSRILPVMTCSEDGILGVIEQAHSLSWCKDWLGPKVNITMVPRQEESISTDPPLQDDIVEESIQISSSVSTELKRESKNKSRGDEKTNKALFSRIWTSYHLVLRKRICVLRGNFMAMFYVSHLISLTILVRAETKP